MWYWWYSLYTIKVLCGILHLKKCGIGGNVVFIIFLPFHEYSFLSIAFPASNSNQKPRTR